MTERLKRAIEAVIEAYAVGNLTNAYSCLTDEGQIDMEEYVDDLIAELEDAYEEAEG